MTCSALLCLPASLPIHTSLDTRQVASRWCAVTNYAFFLFTLGHIFSGFGLGWLPTTAAAKRASERLDGHTCTPSLSITLSLSLSPATYGPILPHTHTYTWLVYDALRTVSFFSFCCFSASCSAWILAVLTELVESVLSLSFLFFFGFTVGHDAKPLSNLTPSSARGRRRSHFCFLVSS